MMLSLFSFILFLAVLVCVVYLWWIAAAGVRTPAQPPETQVDLPRFAIAIPAHNEQAVIGRTVATIMQMDYPPDHFDVFVVADFCSDATAEEAEAHGAFALRRLAGERGGKAAALRDLFTHILKLEKPYDAFIIFDADTCVHPQFLRAMSAELAKGHKAVQGRHVISNPKDGWFPAITWAMMTIDNRFNNQGRANLGLSAKHMGDSICFRRAIIEEIGWGHGLTEDYDFRLLLLEKGICIGYQPWAIGFGQAPRTIKDAQAQRLRWARGIAEAKKSHSRSLLADGLRQRSLSKLDGALEASIPSYTSLTLISFFALAFHLLFPSQFLPPLAWLWGLAVLTWFCYPLFGLAVEHAPAWAFLAILSGPVFMIWRTWVKILARLFPHRVTWVRTTHH